MPILRLYVLLLMMLLYVKEEAEANKMTKEEQIGRLLRPGYTYRLNQYWEYWKHWGWAIQYRLAQYSKYWNMGNIGPNPMFPMYNIHKGWLNIETLGQTYKGIFHIVSLKFSSQESQPIWGASNRPRSLSGGCKEKVSKNVNNATICNSDW